MSEGALCDYGITLDSQDSISVGVVSRVTFEVSGDDLDFVARENCNRRNFTMDFFEDAV